MSKKITLGGLAFIWIVAFILLRDSSIAGSNYWMGCAFGIAGFAAAAAIEQFTPGSNNSTFETGAIKSFYTFAFAGVMAVLNIIFACVQDDSIRPLFVIANLLVILGYGLMIYSAAKHLSRVNELTEYAPVKMRNTASISQELSVLLSIAQDPAVKQELMKFKENVVYSTNVSQGFSEDYEKLIIDKLSIIRSDLASGAGSDAVIAKIRDASVTWNMRNSVINSPR